MTYLLKISHADGPCYATEEVEARSALHALADYVDTRIPPPKEYLIRVCGDTVTMTSEHYTIEARAVPEAVAV